MNFSSMEYFDVLSQERSFTRAAERLHMTQQSLSAHIAGLEQELGCQLIVRRVPLELTYAGETLLRYARSIQRTEEDLRREFCDIAQNQKGVLRIGAGAARGQMLLPQAIARFHGRFPHIRIDLTEGANESLHQALTRGDLDLAIADFPKALPGVSLRDFYREEVALIMEKGFFARVFGPEADRRREEFSAGSFAGLRACPLVLGTREDADGRIALDLLKRFQIDRPQIVAQSHNAGTLVKLSAWGVGACFCSRAIAETMLTEAQLAEMLFFPLGEAAAIPIRFGFREGSYQWSVLDAFMVSAREALGA